jgi:hypothetical protein
MSYTVTWRHAAQQRLAALWTGATDRGAVTDAANQIDDELERDPLSAGESRPGVSRILIVPPLAVLFTVDAGRREVTVWSVWRSRR